MLLLIFKKGMAALVKSASLITHEQGGDTWVYPLAPKFLRSSPPPAARTLPEEAEISGGILILMFELQTSVSVILPPLFVHVSDSHRFLGGLRFGSVYRKPRMFFWAPTATSRNAREGCVFGFQ